MRASEVNKILSNTVTNYSGNSSGKMKASEVNKILQQKATEQRQQEEARKKREAELAANQKYLISSSDVTGDGVFDARDIVRAKKMTAASPTADVKTVNQQNTNAIRNQMLEMDEDEIKYESLKTIDLNQLKQEIEQLENKRSQYIALKKEREDYYNKLVNSGGRGLVSGSLSEYDAKKDKKYLEYSKQLAAFGDIDEELTNKKSDYNNAKRIQENRRLSSVADVNSVNYDSDFEKYADKGKALSTERNAWYKSGYKNQIGYLRENPELIKSYDNIKDENGAIADSIFSNQLTYLAAKYMTDSEFAIYNYYLAKETEGLVAKGTAEKYLKSIQEVLTDRQGKDIADSRDSTLSKYTYGYKSGIDQHVQGLINRFNSEDDYIATTGTQKASAQIREDIKEKHGIVGQVGYDIINTTSNMLPSILTSAAANMILPGSGAVVGAGIMGASASGSAYQEMLNLGYDKKQANTYSLLVGASEAALSYAFSGISSLGGALTDDILKTAIEGIDNGIAKFAIEFGGKLLSEGLEEAAQEVLTPLFENIALGYDKNSFKDINWSDVAYSGLLGALSAGLLEGVPTAQKNIKREFKKEKTFAKQVDDVINGTHNPRLDLYVSETPKVFTDIGFSNSALLMRNGKVNEILKKHPEMSVENIKKIPEALQNPILILKSKTNPENSVVAITDISTEKGNMVVPVWVNETGNYIDIELGEEVNTKTNFVASAYGRNVKALIEYANQNDGFLYQNGDIEKVRQLLARNGLQLPTPLKLSDSNINISQNDNDVNNIISTGAEDNAYSSLKSGKPHHTTKAEQKYIKQICNKLGREVVFETITPEILKSKYGKDTNGETPDGFIDKDGVIHIGFTVVDPLKFVFKHELTHFGEGAEQYKKFVKAVKGSKLFREWLAERTKSSSANDVESLIEMYETIYKRNSSEMYADFCGDRLFTDDGSGLEALVSSIDVKDRPAFWQYILDFIDYLKKKLAGDKNISFELSRLEDSFNRMISEAQLTKQAGDKKTTDSSDIKFTFARVQNQDLIDKAEKMEAEGANREEIWKEHLIVRDAAGEWVYEISNDELEVRPNGDAINKVEPEYDEYLALAKLKRRTPEKSRRFMELCDKYGHTWGKEGKLEDFVIHDKLFEKYPFLRDINFKFVYTNDFLGCYYPQSNRIEINQKYINPTFDENLEDYERSFLKFANEIQLKNTIIHEIQHAMQEHEDRESGASDLYWATRALTGNIPLRKNGEPMEPFEAAWNTAGEIEARAAGVRVTWDEKSRAEEMPDLGWDEAVFTSKDYTPVHSDAEYMAAVESGDIEAVRSMVDDVAESAGYTERLYHQTGADFTEFNTENQSAGKYDFELPTGTFLKPSSEDIGLKGKKQMELYARLQNPLEFADRQAAQKYWRENVEGYAEAVRKVERVDNEYSQRYSDAEGDVRRYMLNWKHNNPQASRRDIYKDAEFIRLHEREQEILEEWESAANEASLKAKGLINDYISQTDYDGIIIEKDQDGDNISTKSYIVFDSNQLKDAAAVTYDDKGEVVPLSQRFNTEQSDIRFSIPRKSIEISSEPIDLSSDSELSKRIGNIYGSQKYKIIQNYILEILDEQPIILSDGKKAIVDRSDAQHIVRNAGNKKTTQISQIKKIIEDAKLVAEENSTKERKFNYFYYYEAFVKYGEDIYPIYLNVGKAKNDGTYHIYDITQKLRDTAHRVNDVERPKPNEGYALKNGISNNSISKYDDKVNPKFSMPSEAGVLFREFENGKITKEEYNNRMDELWDKTISELEDEALAQRIVELREKNKRYSQKLSYRKRQIKRKNEQLKKQSDELKRYNEEVTPYGTLSFGENWRITKNVLSRIKTRRDTNSDKKHIPEGLKPYTDKLLTSFMRDDPMPFSGENLIIMKSMYEKFAGKDDVMEQIGYDPEIAFVLDELSESIDGKTIKELQFDELLSIRQVTENLWHMIQKKEEVIIEGKKQQIRDIGEKVLQELSLKKRKRGNVLTQLLDKAEYANMIPIYFFERIGGPFEGLFNTLLDGEDTNQRNLENGKTYINNTQDEYNYSKWGTDNLKPITTEHGKKVSLSVEQAMLLYATHKREKSRQIDQTEHILEGGITVPKHQMKFEEKLLDIEEKFKNSDNKGAGKLYDALTDELNEGAIKITETDVANLVNQLTQEQKNYADSIVKYLSEDMAALGNQTSMEFFGYCKYNDKYYIPFCSAKNYLNIQIGTMDGNNLSLKHSSFTHNLSKGAKTPLVMGNFSEVCADHINKMCRYNASAVTLDAMLKILNYKTDNKTVASEFGKVYGQDALNYLKDFLQKMNGTAGKDDSDAFFNKMISLYRKNAVSASLSVAIQQPTSLPRAMIEIDPKYFVGKSPKSDYEEMLKYSPVAGMKERGRVDIGTGSATVKWMLNQTPESFSEKAKALVDVKDSTYRDDKFMRLAAKGDEWTWRHIWSAVKREVADKHPDLKVGTNEFFEACNKRFRYIINKTQVYDSPVSKSKMMSSKSVVSKMLTAFAAESTVWINILLSINKTNAVRVLSVYIITGALNAALKSFVTAPRDDEEEETYWEKWWEDFGEAFIDNTIFVTNIPILRDVISLIKGFDIERPDMSAITDVIDAYNALGSEKKSTYRKIEDFAGAIAAFFGLPVKNVMRDVRAAYNSYKDIFVNDKEDRAVNKEVNDYMDELDDNKTYQTLEDEEKEDLEKKIIDTVRDVRESKADKKRSEKFDELYAELIRGEKWYKKMRKEMIEEGYTAKEITDGVEIARIAYMKSQGIDIHEYLLYKIATNKKHADKDKSGGVDKEERKQAIEKMDLERKTKDYFIEDHK